MKLMVTLECMLSNFFALFRSNRRMAACRGVRSRRRKYCLFAGCLVVLLCFVPPASIAEEDSSAQAGAPHAWKFGVARSNITPGRPMLMSGYASRETPATGKLMELWAKAVVIQDESGERGVLITADLIGIGATSTQRIRTALKERHGLPAESIMICCSHTHTGPAVAETLAPMNYFYATPTQREAIDAYTRLLESQVVQIVDEAIGKLEPGRLSWGNGSATFAANRRENDERRVLTARAGKQLLGPFDHDVPVLAIHDTQKRLRAVVFGYACHATVLDSFQWSGDYPGYAQLEIERLHPDCIAMFWAGCGADQNPLPRRSVALAEHYGRRLATAVEEVLLTHAMKPVTSSLSCAHTTLELAYASLPSIEDIQRDMQSRNKFEVARASMLKAVLETDGVLRASYSYPIARWQLGQIEWLFLGGEVVVDYALRLKGHDKGTRTWVAAYANDVMAYIPSERVLREGRYEGGGAMVYYGLPSPWAPGLESRIIGTIASFR